MPGKKVHNPGVPVHLVSKCLMWRTALGVHDKLQGTSRVCQRVVKLCGLERWNATVRHPHGRMPM